MAQRKRHGAALKAKVALEAIYPKPRLSAPGEGHKRYPHLLRDIEARGPTRCGARTSRTCGCAKASCTSRRSWTGTAGTCCPGHCRRAWTRSRHGGMWALEEALRSGTPEIFNTDQGVQFTSAEFTGVLERAGIAISMDGRGRAFDDIFSERLWRTVKYQEVYLNDYGDGREAHDRLKAYFRFYNEERPHQALGYRTPAEVHAGRTGGEESRPAEGRTVVPQGGIALRAHSVPATVGLTDSLNGG